jgi:hypothetical protein
MYFATIKSWKLDIQDSETNILCDVELPDNMGGGIRGPYTYITPPHSQIFPYIGMNVQVQAWSGFGVCFAVTQDLTSTSKLEPRNVQIGAIEQGVTITFTSSGVTVDGPNVTVNTQKAVINATDTEINGQNIALNVAEITSTANITTSGNITGALITGTTDVKAGNVSLKNHKHNVTSVGSPTSPPTP